MGLAYYNEIDPFAAAWLQRLINSGHIAPGIVDTRSIEDVRPDDLREFTQCHFFAGIGVWSHALRLSGWPDDRPVWTGSCPCQPFSAAGKGDGFADERHLWPSFFHLIKERRPVPVFGEQVASKDGLAWLDLVHTDLEGEGYAVGAADLCAAGVGAPHIRQRFYWVADSVGEQRDRCGGIGRGRGSESADSRTINRLGDTCSEGLAQRQRVGRISGATRSAFEGKTIERAGLHLVGRAANAEGGRRGEERPDIGGCVGRDYAQRVPAGHRASRSDMHACPTNGFWRDADWLGCLDGKWRPVEPGTRPLAHGAAARVGRLRAYGNAINVYQAEAFITAYMESI